jgi:hypothetical protein
VGTRYGLKDGDDNDQHETNGKPDHEQPERWPGAKVRHHVARSDNTRHKKSGS